MRLIMPFVLLATVLTACGDDGGDASGSGGGSITVNGTEPENPLIPTNTNETGGTRVLDALFSRLVRFNPKDGHTENDVAESVTSTDSREWTIRLKPDQRFHDNTPVTADSFVKAWNWGANAANSQQNASFFSQIEGYADVHPEDPDGPDGPAEAPKPTATTMSGLKVIDDRTLTATLSAPFSLFPMVIGHVSYSPLPEAFYADPEAFGQKPIGNGPFRFDRWEHNSEIVVSRFNEHTGDRKPSVDGVTFKIYPELTAAYADLLTNNLDYLDTIPPSALADRRYERELGQGRYAHRPVLINSTITFPLYQDRYRNPDLRRALSLAVDRAQIADRIFQGTRRPATGYGVSGLADYQPTDCQYCGFNPEEAKRLFAASGTPADTRISIAYASDGPNKEMSEAVCGSITNTLGLPCGTEPLTFSVLRTNASAHQMTAVFESGWAADYPSLENFLNPLFRTDAAANDSTYSNPEVDAALKRGDEATDAGAAANAYNEAQRLILNDMPEIPLFEVIAATGTSDRMEVAETNIFGNLDLFTARVR